MLENHSKAIELAWWALGQVFVTWSALAFGFKEALILALSMTLAYAVWLIATEN